MGAHQPAQRKAVLGLWERMGFHIELVLLRRDDEVERVPHR